MSDDSLTKDLKAKLGELQAEYDRVHEELDDIEQRQAAIRSALVGLGAIRPEVPDLSRQISEKLLERVAKELDRAQQISQADLTKATKLNSGSVSVALRVLEQQKRAKRVNRKERGSQVWAAD